MSKYGYVKRNRMRIFLGRQYYTMKRYCNWMFGGIKFAKRRQQETDFQYVYFKHSTPLLRKLQGVDMQLQYNKVSNLKIAAAKINQIVINPGETFSYWKLIGKPTRWKGYKEGLVLFCGTYKQGVGGGLCQLSNLIYWMALHTPLTVIERYRHSYDVFPDSNRKLPFGSGATCVYNYKDLMIKNETSTPFQINVWLTKDSLCGNFKANVVPLESYHVYEKNHYMAKEMFGGYSRNNEIYRAVYNMDGEQIADEYVTENHALMMYEPMIEEKEERKELLK